MQISTDVKEGFQPCSVTIKIENENELGFLWAMFNAPFRDVYKNALYYKSLDKLSADKQSTLSSETYRAWKAFDDLMKKFKMR